MRLDRMVIIVTAVLMTFCASAPQRDPAVTAGENARSFSGLQEMGTGFFGGTRVRGTGQLEIGSGGALWTNSSDSGRSFALRPEVISRVWLTCASRPSENLCLDLGIQTLTGNEYHFRDVNWEGGVNREILDAYEHMRTLYPQARFDRRAVDRVD